MELNQQSLYFIHFDNSLLLDNEITNKKYYIARPICKTRSENTKILETMTNLIHVHDRSFSWVCIDILIKKKVAG